MEPPVHRTDLTFVKTVLYERIEQIMRLDVGQVFTCIRFADRHSNNAV